MNIRDLRLVRIKLWEARTKWMSIGVELGLTYVTLEEIEQQTNHSDPGECFTKLLARWLESSDPPATWSTMLDALRSPTINLTHLANSTEEDLKVESQTDIRTETEYKCNTTKVNNLL